MKIMKQMTKISFDDSITDIWISVLYV